jgi:ribonuclease D
MIIQTQQQLDNVCARLSQGDYITIDTEFLRDRTFYPRLCLLQMAGPDVDAVAVDPIEFPPDWTSLNALLHNEKVLKVFHAARQDLEIFYYMNNAIPHPIFDTQVAAMVCGYGDSIAYNKLVQDITGHALAKNAQFTDWSRRPLSKKQLDYALDDVIYLREVYDSLNATLKKQKRENWLKQEMNILTSPETYEMPVDEVWKRIKIRSDKPEVLAVLRELAKWREEKAREKDVPRNRIMKDDALADVAIYMPKDVEGLRRMRSLPKEIATGKAGEILLDLVAKARKTPEDTWPTAIRKPPFPKEAVPVLEMLKLLLKINCSESDVASKLVANVSDLEELAVTEKPEGTLMKGWRYEIFGKDAIALKEGKLYLGLKDGKIFKKYA